MISRDQDRIIWQTTVAVTRLAPRATRSYLAAVLLGDCHTGCAVVQWGRTGCSVTPCSKPRGLTGRAGLAPFVLDRTLSYPLASIRARGRSHMDTISQKSDNRVSNDLDRTYLFG